MQSKAKISKQLQKKTLTQTFEGQGTRSQRTKKTRYTAKTLKQPMEQNRGTQTTSYLLTVNNPKQFVVTKKTTTESVEETSEQSQKTRPKPTEQTRKTLKTPKKPQQQTDTIEKLPKPSTEKPLQPNTGTQRPPKKPFEKPLKPFEKPLKPTQLLAIPEFSEIEEFFDSHWRSGKEIVRIIISIRMLQVSRKESQY